jgi:ubiquinone/menaquinone biosynthesis C-methylase UbiE
MAATSPDGFDAKLLHDKVVDTYDRVARDPGGEFHFHRGTEFAVELLRYDREELSGLPDRATEAFAGVANPHRIGPIHSGETVLDIGSGAGTDLLLAAQRVGATGRAIGIDPTASMRERARASADEAGLGDIVELREGRADQLPVEADSIDVVISNGVVNLSPDKRLTFAEIARVLKPGGRLYLADVSVARELSLDARSDVDLWAA